MTRVSLGYVALVLHAHLPFVRHPDRDDCIEERWLHEAVCECYLPLLQVLERLAAASVPFRLTLSLSPTLMAMLDDPLLRERTERYIRDTAALAERETRYTAGTPAHAIAHFYRQRYRRLHRLFAERYRQDILTAFHTFAQAGYLSLITTAATHGFLPAFQSQPAVVRAQIGIAIDLFRRRFGHAPRGFWLPECGYFPGVDRLLREAGVEFAFSETHGLTHARPAPPMGPYAHAWTPAGLALFARDPESSQQVWSAGEGYPGHPTYREFYWDVGFERDLAHLGSMVGAHGSRTFTGLKYRRVTGPTEQKEYYDPLTAEQMAVRHAGHFLLSRVRQMAFLRGLFPGEPPPLVVAPYDAELFGHWWFEGPLFLEAVARQAHRQNLVRFISPADFIDMHSRGQGVAEPGYSTWGDRGYADFWVDEANHWLYRHLHQAGKDMVRLAATAPPGMGQPLNQAARELLLAQASDWAFIIRAGTASDYARQRVRQHLSRFRRIAGAVADGHAPDPVWLGQVEAADNLFPHLDYRVFAGSGNS